MSFVSLQMPKRETFFRIRKQNKDRKGISVENQEAIMGAEISKLSSKFRAPLFCKNICVFMFAIYFMCLGHTPFC